MSDEWWVMWWVMSDVMNDEWCDVMMWWMIWWVMWCDEWWVMSDEWWVMWWMMWWVMWWVMSDEWCDVWWVMSDVICDVMSDESWKQWCMNHQAPPNTPQGAPHIPSTAQKNSTQLPRYALDSCLSPHPARSLTHPRIPRTHSAHRSRCAYTRIAACCSGGVSDNNRDVFQS